MLRSLRYSLVALALSGVPASACGVELVLAVDVSRSVIEHEYKLQVAGLANAFRSEDVIDAIKWVPGGVMATLTQWSGPEDQEQSIGWRLLDTPVAISAFANEIDETERAFFSAFTAVGEALSHADGLSATNPSPCKRRIIDISGDGASNRGREPGPIAEALAAAGVTINAVVIKGARPDPEQYFRTHVVRGHGAFIEVATSFDDYARAIERKLLRELSPAFSAR